MTPVKVTDILVYLVSALVKVYVFFFFNLAKLGYSGHYVVLIILHLSCDHFLIIHRQSHFNAFMLHIHINVPSGLYIWVVSKFSYCK